MAGFSAVFVPVLALILIAFALMAIGVIMRRPCLRGSCGGPAIHGPDGTPLSCATCPKARSSKSASSVAEPAGGFGREAAFRHRKTH
jgi:hypothetical protein